MFVEYAAEIDVPEPVAAQILANDYKEMEGMGTAAYRKGEELRSRVGPGGLLAKEVVVGIGEPKMSRRGVVIPVRWRATGAEALFPRLEGELQVLAVDDRRTSLRLQATYRPPLGTIGDLMDRLVLARLARATVADWVERIAEWVTETARSVERQHHLDDSSRSDHRPE